MMTLSIPLSTEVETALRQRATAAGKDPATIAGELLSRVLIHGCGLTLERLEEISGDSQRTFAASGMTDDQLGEELDNLKHADRSKKRGITFHE
jgi:hypothetical protein